MNKKYSTLLLLLCMTCILFSGCSKDETILDDIENEDPNQGSTGEDAEDIAPYTSYIKVVKDYDSKNPLYYQLTSAMMRVIIDYTSVNNTGTNFKELYIDGNGNETWIRLQYLFYQNEYPTNVMWSAGTYSFGSGYHNYGCLMSIPDFTNNWVGGQNGKCTIKYDDYGIIIDINGTDRFDHLIKVHYEGDYTVIQPDYL